MFMIATIQITVSGLPTQPGIVCTPASGSVKWLIQIPKPTGMAAAAIWPPSFSHGRRPRKSSIAPTVVATAAPSRIPRASLFSFRKARAGTITPRKSASPPSRGIGRVCSLRPPGLSTTPSSRAIPPTAGVSSTTMTSARSAPQTTSGCSVSSSQKVGCRGRTASSAQHAHDTGASGGLSRHAARRTW